MLTASNGIEAVEPVNYSKTDLRVCNPSQVIDLFIGSLPGFLEKSLSLSSNYCHEARTKNFVAVNLRLIGGEPLRLEELIAIVEANVK